jgi:hypothetical protein
MIPLMSLLGESASINAQSTIALLEKVGAKKQISLNTSL